MRLFVSQQLLQFSVLYPFFFPVTFLKAQTPNSQACYELPLYFLLWYAQCNTEYASMGETHTRNDVPDSLYMN